MVERNPVEFEYPAPNGGKIVSTPAEFKAANGVVECDGFTHRVFDKDGNEIGQAGTLGLARKIARNGGPLPDIRDVVIKGTVLPGGSKKGRKK